MGYFAEVDAINGCLYDNSLAKPTFVRHSTSEFELNLDCIFGVRKTCLSSQELRQNSVKIVSDLG